MTIRSWAFGALMAFGVATSVSPSIAAPVVGSADSVVAQSPAALEQVQYRRGWGGPVYRSPGYRGYGWGRPGPYIGLGIAAGVAAGAIIYSQSYLPRRGYYYDTYAYSGPYYYPEDYRGDPRELCARYFKSFEWGSGMYTTYGGERRLCPYLRGD